MTFSARVSILLPTYNRARFLPAAFGAIAAQTFSDWELVVVDDGSTDDTAEVVHALGATFTQPVKYVAQKNAGAYAARNVALDHAAGTYAAFYDSDDLWLPHHLAHSVSALDLNADLDWVYAACRLVDHETARTIDPDTFLLNGRPRPFRNLRVLPRGPVRIFDDERVVAWALRYGLYRGLQNSVIRRSVFEALRFHTAFRNEAEDQLFAIRALKRGHRVGYLEDVHVQYHVHDANSSASGTGQTLDRQLSVYRPLVRGFNELRGAFTWSPLERRELSRRLAADYFWHLGYAILWKEGRRREALDAYRNGLREWPWSLACWKTYAIARLRCAFDQRAQ